MTNQALLINLTELNKLPNDVKTRVINSWIKKLEKTTSKYTYIEG